MAKRYRKRPIEIEAMQWDGTAEGATPIIQWTDDHGGTAAYCCAELNNDCRCSDPEAPHAITIDTLEGIMAAGIGDWLVRGIEGEFYPVREDIFAATYEPVEPERCPD